MFYLLFTLTLSYLLGSIPFGLLITKIKKLPDLRTVGSGNIGATNVLRVGGLKLAITVWLLDMIKAIISVSIAFYFTKHFNLLPITPALSGLFVILGHCFPIWLKFKGGKGVSSLFGIILTINPLIFLCNGLIWLIVALSTGYSSLGAIITFVTLPIFIYFIYPKMTFIFILISILCIYKHRSNIKKLLTKTESKIKWRKN